MGVVNSYLPLALPSRLGRFGLACGCCVLGGKTPEEVYRNRYAANRSWETWPTV